MNIPYDSVCSATYRHNRGTIFGGYFEGIPKDIVLNVLATMGWNSRKISGVVLSNISHNLGNPLLWNTSCIKFFDSESINKNPRWRRKTKTKSLKKKWRIWMNIYAEKNLSKGKRRVWRVNARKGKRRLGRGRKMTHALLTEDRTVQIPAAFDRRFMIVFRFSTAFFLRPLLPGVCFRKFGNNSSFFYI